MKGAHKISSNIKHRLGPNVLVMHIPDEGEGLEKIVNLQKSTRKMRKGSQSTRLTR